MAETPDPQGQVITATVSALSVSYVVRSRGHEGLRDIFEVLGIDRITELINQPDLWIEYDEAMAAVAAAEAICGQDDIGYHLGEEAARVMFDQGRLHSFRNRPFDETVAALVELLNSGNALRRLEIASTDEDGEAAIEATPLAGTSDRLLCRFGTGFLTAVPAYLGRAGVAVELACVAHGAPRCRFVVRWQPARSDGALMTMTPTSAMAIASLAGSSAADRLRPGTAVDTEQGFADLHPQALAEILERVIERIALPQHVVSVHATLVNEDGGDEARYTRGVAHDASDAAAGASFTASIEGVAGLHGTATIVFAGRGLPSVDQPLAESVAHQIASILADASAMAELRTLARSDVLTGLANRATLEERSARIADGTALIFLDLDGFKAVNDERGHRAGDAVLAQLGERLRRAVRTTDLIARYGGDEFVAMIDGTPSLDDAHAVATKLMAVFDEPFSLEGGALALRASCGVARAPDDGRAFAALLAVADERMYRDKRSRSGTNGGGLSGR